MPAHGCSPWYAVHRGSMRPDVRRARGAPRAHAGTRGTHAVRRAPGAGAWSRGGAPHAHPLHPPRARTGGGHRPHTRHVAHPLSHTASARALSKPGRSRKAKFWLPTPRGRFRGGRGREQTRGAREGAAPDARVVGHHQPAYLHMPYSQPRLPRTSRDAAVAMISPAANPGHHPPGHHSPLNPKP